VIAEETEPRRPQHPRRTSFLWASLFSLLFLLFLYRFFFIFALWATTAFSTLLTLSFHDALTQAAVVSFTGAGPPLFPLTFSLSSLHRALLSTHLPNPMRGRTRRFIVFFTFALALLGLASAAPLAGHTTTETFYRRQAQGAPLSQTVVTQTVQTTQTFVLSLCLTGAQS